MDLVVAVDRELERRRKAHSPPKRQRRAGRPRPCRNSGRTCRPHEARVMTISAAETLGLVVVILLDAGGNAAAIVGHGAGAIGIEGHGHPVAWPASASSMALSTTS